MPDLIIFLGILFYIVPAFIALVRGHRQVVPIILLNLLLGWTLLGWVGALIWASVSYAPPPQTAPYVMKQ